MTKDNKHSDSKRAEQIEKETREHDLEIQRNDADRVRGGCCPM